MSGSAPQDLVTGELSCTAQSCRVRNAFSQLLVHERPVHVSKDHNRLTLLLGSAQWYLGSSSPFHSSSDPHLQTSSQDPERKWKESFALLDQRGNGYISTEELASVLKSLGANPTPQQLKEFVDSVDDDGNGKIEYNEVVSCALGCSPHS